jgi:hypothetical protein
MFPTQKYLESLEKLDLQNFCLSRIEYQDEPNLCNFRFIFDNGDSLKKTSDIYGLSPGKEFKSEEIKEKVKDIHMEWDYKKGNKSRKYLSRLSLFNWAGKPIFDARTAASSMRYPKQHFFSFEVNLASSEQIVGVSMDVSDSMVRSI